MKKLLTFSIIIIAFTCLNSEIMKINLSNGEVVEFNTSHVEEITFSPDTSVEEIVEFISQIPIKFLRNYPNPFNPATTISFTIAEKGKTKVEIFNIKGQKVKTLVNRHLDTGNHSFKWNGDNDNNKKITSGMYFYKVSVNNSQKVNKMIMIK